jgi:predicted Zn-dependent protease
MAARAGWDPAALSTFLHTLGREVDLMSKEPRKPSFFDSHPATPDRVAKTAEHAKMLKQADRERISPTPEAFLVRLDGLVVGQRAANGLIAGHRFVHPDLDFFVQFPEKWPVENTSSKVVAAAPDGEAAVVLQTVAEGTDPLDGARAAETATKLPLLSKTRTMTINGLPAAHTHLEAEGKVGIDLTWIAHGGLIFQVTGLAPTKRFSTLEPIFVSSAESFRPLSSAERTGIREKRIRLVRAQAGETIETIGARSNSAWRKEEIAVANNLSVEDHLKEGRLLKIAVAELYEPKDPMKKRKP